MDKKSLIVAGVGGQGIILTSEVVSYVLFKSGFDVKKNEIHGMSQRGGSVVSYIMWGEKVYSPMPELGKSDIILAFEKLESLRYINYLKKGGVALVSDIEIEPVPVKLGNTEYPKNIASKFDKFGRIYYLIDTLNEIKELKNMKVANIFMVGVLSQFIEEVKPDLWKEAIKKLVKERYVEVNLRAFEKGRNLSIKGE